MQVQYHCVAVDYNFAPKTFPSSNSSLIGQISNKFFQGYFASLGWNCSSQPRIEPTNQHNHRLSLPCQLRTQIFSTCQWHTVCELRHISAPYTTQGQTAWPGIDYKAGYYLTLNTICRKVIFFSRSTSAELSSSYFLQDNSHANEQWLIVNPHIYY